MESNQELHEFIPDNILDDILAELGIENNNNLDLSSPASEIDEMLTDFFLSEENSIRNQRNIHIQYIQNLVFDTDIMNLSSVNNSNNMMKILYFLLFEFLRFLNSKRGGFLSSDLIHSLVLCILKDCCRGNFYSLFDIIFN